MFTNVRYLVDIRIHIGYLDNDSLENDLFLKLAAIKNSKQCSLDAFKTQLAGGRDHFWLQIFLHHQEVMLVIMKTKSVY